MPDIYLYEDVPVLRNLLGIRSEELLDKVEAEMSRANMMLLYESGFNDFSPRGLCELHRRLFCEIYEWAGKYRVINIEKRERILGGRSVWYSNDEDIPRELDAAFKTLNSQPWFDFSKNEFVSAIVKCFAPVWRVHPFREGNTRTVVLMLSLFVEAKGYCFDHELLAQSAGYVRDSFVMASLDEYSEYEHLEKILLDAVCEEPVSYDTGSVALTEMQGEKYTKYQKNPYKPEPHYQREDPRD